MNPEQQLIAQLQAQGQAAFIIAMRQATQALQNVGQAANQSTVSTTALSASTGSMTATMIASRVVIGGLTVSLLGLAAISLLPLAASAGAAALAFGALGIAAGAVMLPAMALAAGVAARFKDTVDIAGSGAWDLRDALAELKHAADRAISPAAAMMMHRLATAARTLAPLVETLRKPFAKFARISGDAVVTVAKGIAELGPEIRSFVARSAGLFRALAPAVTPVAGLLLDIANATLPHLVRMAREVATTVAGWRVHFADTGRLGDTIGTLIGHLRSWVRLGVNVGRVMFAIGKALAPTGKGWVDVLADAAGGAADFLSSAKGLGMLRGIYGGLTTGLRMVGQGFSFLVRVGRQAGAQVIEALKPAMPFVRNVLAPLFLGLAKGVLGSVVGAFKFLLIVGNLLAQGLGWLGTKAEPLRGVFEGIGTVLGFVFGGAILRLLSAVPKLGIVFRVAGAMIGAVGRIVGVVAGSLMRVFAPVVGVVRGYITGVTSVIRGAASTWWGALRGAFNFVVSRAGSVGRLFVSIGRTVVQAIARGIQSAPGALLNALRNIMRQAINGLPGPLKEGVGALLGAFADGGTAGRSGAYLVGEKGPEVVNLKAGDQVTPNAALGALPRGGGGGTFLRVEAPITLNGRELGRGVATIAGDDLAGP